MEDEMHFNAHTLNFPFTFHASYAPGNGKVITHLHFQSQLRCGLKLTYCRFKTSEKGVHLCISLGDSRSSTAESTAGSGPLL